MRRGTAAVSRFIIAGAGGGIYEWLLLLNPSVIGVPVNLVPIVAWTRSLYRTDAGGVPVAAMAIGEAGRQKMQPSCLPVEARAIAGYVSFAEEQA